MHGGRLLHIAFAALLGSLSPLAPGSTPAALASESCNARENLEEIAVAFISRCCKASIYRESPSELLFTKLIEIKRGTTAAHRKAWKLLNDNRFKK